MIQSRVAQENATAKFGEQEFQLLETRLAHPDTLRVLLLRTRTDIKIYLHLACVPASLFDYIRQPIVAS